jgi:hypothetical protein
MTTDPLPTAQKRAIQYWYVDGTFEFSFGGLCLILSAYFYTNYLLAESWIANLLTALFILVIIGGGYLVNRLVLTMKERLTFPRTGYIAFSRPAGSKRWGRALLVGLVAAALSGVLAFLLMNHPLTFDWATAATGLVFSAVVVYLGLRSELARFFLEAALSLALGLALGFVNLPKDLGLTSFYGLLGLLLLLFGAFNLWQYLRANPAPVEDRDER